MSWRWLEKTEKNNSTIALDVLYAKKMNIYIYIYEWETSVCMCYTITVKQKAQRLFDEFLYNTKIFF